MYRANRIAYSLTHGPVPPGLVVMHTCDRPICVRPSHLQMGTYQDNVLDCWRKGRNRRVPVGSAHHLRQRPELTPRGERNGNAKLTEAGVREILTLQNVLSPEEVATRFHVAELTITAIWAGRTWKHVPRGENYNA